MAVLMQIKNATKSYGNQVLLDNAEATLSEDIKVGFVGRNGAGKSTLLRILSPDIPSSRSAICDSMTRSNRGKPHRNS